MAKERVIGIEERKIIDFPTSKYKYFEELERRLLNQDDRLFSHNIRKEIVDRNIDFEEK